MKKTVAKYLCIILSAALLLTALPLTVYAEDSVNEKEVGTADELAAACTEITENGGEYVINLTADIIGGYIDIKKSGAVVTVNGNGHTITNYRNAVNVSGGATVKLSGGSSTLTLQGSDDPHEIPVGNDEPGLICVLSGSTCTMSDNVTLKNHKGNNYLGGGVTVQGGTFVMNGGTIENCGIDGGSVCFGGGVAVYNGGYFEMNGGSITNCYAISDYVDDYDPNRCFTAVGGGVFVTKGSSFTMNGGTISGCEATNMGGGVAQIIFYDEMRSCGMGNLQSTVTINDGTISGNKAGNGAGVFSSAYFYCYADAIRGYESGGIGTQTNPGLYINGGKINQNEADRSGGGVFIAGLRPNTNTVVLHNAEITENKAYSGAGIDIFGYWTETHIDGCMITGNNATNSGGGVSLDQGFANGTIPGKTYLKDTVVTNNTSGEIGAGVIYNNASNLMISGANIIQNNTYNGKLNNLNVLDKDYPVYVDGNLTGSKIGLSDPTLWNDNLSDLDAPDDGSAELLTSGYKATNPEVHPDQYFTSDHESWVVERTAKTTTTKPDPNSKTYREYKVKRYAAVLPNTAAYAGCRYQYVITDVKNPALTDISTNDDIISELKYRFESSNNYTVKDQSVPSYGSTYITYTPKASDSTASSIRLQKAPNKNEVTLTYNGKQPRGSSVTFTASPNIQSRYANSGKLVLQITSSGDNYLNNYTFSNDYTEETIDYVNANPPGNVLYEYDEDGDVAAKLEIVSYETKSAQITVETGTEDEVRLVRKDINYHINNEEIDDNYNNNDIFTSYVEAATKEIKVGDTIEKFYKIPEVKATESSSCPYIFKGWYYDPENDNDARPVTFGTDKYSKDIYAHWIKVENVAKDADDDNELPPTYNNSYGGFDLVGVQVREGIRDTNYGEEKKPGGLRFVTSLNMDVVNQIKAIKQNNIIEYGYVAATNKGWIDYHSKDADRKLQYVSETANGIDTSSDKAENKNYFGFASNIICTSRKTNGSGEVKEDHRNFDGYLLYTLVITYENVDESAKDTNVLARPYIRYWDANGLERVAYSEYRGNSNTLGGCYTSYNAIAGNN